MRSSDSKVRPTVRDWTIASSLLRESDRGCVLIAVAALEEDIERLLRKFLRNDKSSAKYVDDMFHYPGPLSSFAAKTRMGYLVGLYDRETFELMESIRKMRNEFAHGYEPRTFKDVLIRPLISDMVAKQRQRADDVVTKTDCPCVRGRRRELKERIAFMAAVAYIGGRLNSVEEMLQEGVFGRRVFL